jgi:hypothetical protein
LKRLLPISDWQHVSEPALQRRRFGRDARRIVLVARAAPVRRHSDQLARIGGAGGAVDRRHATRPPKGTPRHRAVGYVWAGLMLFIAGSGFWINEIRMFGPFSPIHLLSILVLVTVPLAVWHAHNHRVKRHRWAMILLYFRVDRRRNLHPAAWPDHARGGVRTLTIELVGPG